MSKKIPTKDLRTLGYVLRRTNYGEADRILNLITPSGKITVIAKGARKEKSRLAGAIELFTLTDFNIHQGKSEIKVLTGAKMVKHFSGLMKDLDLLNFGASVLKVINKLAENSDNPEYFKILDQTFKALDSRVDYDVVKAWFKLNIMKANGEEMNLYRNDNGEKLKADGRYVWDEYDAVFKEKNNGEYGANEIKMLRIMSVSDLDTVARIKASDEVKMRVFSLVQRVFGAQNI